ncbi:MAG: hypothetical protein LBI57_04275 [Helicobacteraceae bacterium]|jgi:hypothetical protein|nr:hypothetical protein [Helicobacteraceae bacterium]
MRIEARIFRFNAEHDYLGVYQPFIYRANESATLLDLLHSFKQSDPLCSMRLDNVKGVKANGLGARLDSPLSAFAKKNGDTIVVEPLVSERAVLDLECDRRDFEDKIGVLEEFCDESDREYYDEFYIAYAVSPMRSLNDAYLGEALFMLADRLIGKDPSNAIAIAKRIACLEGGVFCFAGLNGALLNGAAHITKTIERLWTLSASFAPKNVGGERYAALQAADVSRFSGKKTAIATDCGAFAAAPDIEYYEKILIASGAEVLRLPNPSRFSGARVANLLPSVALQAARDLTLEAVDLGADTLACVADETAKFLTSALASVKRAAGREIDITIASCAA